MNIFYLDKDPVKAAEYQYNKHVVKMILETAQILCTTHILIDGDDADVPYKATHKNHPSTVWARQSADNYEWLYNHFIALSNEYTKRYDRVHLSYTKCKDKLKNIPKSLQRVGVTKMPQCMPDEYKDIHCSVKAYWNYYIGEKHIVAHELETKYKSQPYE